MSLCQGIITESPFGEQELHTMPSVHCYWGNGGRTDNLDPGRLALQRFGVDCALAIGPFQYSMLDVAQAAVYAGDCGWKERVRKGEDPIVTLIQDLAAIEFYRVVEERRCKPKNTQDEEFIKYWTSEVPAFELNLPYKSARPAEFIQKLSPMEKEGVFFVTRLFTITAVCSMGCVVDGVEIPQFDQIPISVFFNDIDHAQDIEILLFGMTQKIAGMLEHRVLQPQQIAKILAKALDHDYYAEIYGESNSAQQLVTETIDKLAKFEELLGYEIDKKVAEIVRCELGMVSYGYYPFRQENAGAITFTLPLLTHGGISYASQIDNKNAEG